LKRGEVRLRRRRRRSGYGSGCGGCSGGCFGHTLPRNGLAFLNRTAGFAFVIPEESLGAGLADDGAGCADEEAVLGVRVAQVSRLGAQRREGFGADTPLKRGDIAIDAPVLISGRCRCGGGGSCRGGGCSGRRALPWDRLTFPDGTAGFAFVIPEKSLGAGLAEDHVAEADDISVVGVGITEVGAALTGGLERLGADAALQRRDPAVDASVLVARFSDHQSGFGLNPGDGAIRVGLAPDADSSVLIEEGSTRAFHAGSRGRIHRTHDELGIIVEVANEARSEWFAGAQMTGGELAQGLLRGRGSGNSMAVGQARGYAGP